VADANGSLEWLALQPVFKVAQLAFGTPPGQAASFERSNARRIVAAVFEALERIDQQRCDWLATEYADNSAHGGLPYTLPWLCPGDVVRRLNE
jgi:hypothetical protein